MGKGQGTRAVDDRATNLDVVRALDAQLEEYGRERDR